MAPKGASDFKSSHKRHRQRSAAANPTTTTHDNMHRHTTMAPYPSFNFQDTVTARPRRTMQNECHDDEDEDDDEPVFMPQMVVVRRAAAPAPAPAAVATTTRPGPSQQMSSYDEASPSGPGRQQTHARTHRDNYQAARANEKAAHDELMELYTRLRASKKRGDGAAIDAMDASGRHLHKVYLMWIKKKLEAYHELQLVE